MTAQPGGYRAVGKRLGISGASLNRLLVGKAASSWVVPELLKLFDLDVVEHLSLSDEQAAWLMLLEDLKKAGKDPAEIDASVRQLAGLPKPPK